MLAAIAVVVGLFYSNVAMSIGMMVLLLSGFLVCSKEGIRLRPALADRLGEFLRRPEWSAPVLVLMAVLISGLWSEELGDWIKFSRLKLPFLALPLAFFLREEWTRTELELLERIFLGFAVFSTIPVLVHLWVDFEVINEGLKQGQPIPTPTHHIRYGMLLAFAALLSLFRWMQTSGNRAYLNLLLAVWLIIVLFILATRTGLLVLGAGTGYLLLWLAMRKGRLVWAMGLIGLLSIAMLVAVNTLPTLKTRLSYMRYDWERMQQGDDQFYSDSERWRSLRAGWDIWRSSPWTGTGMGDQRNQTVAYYLETWGLDRHKLPHNQLLFILSSTGLIGLILFLAGTLWPLKYALLFRRPVLILLYLVVMLAGAVEHTLETTTGITLFCYLLAFYTRWYHIVESSEVSSKE